MAMAAGKSPADIVAHLIAQLRPKRAEDAPAAGGPDASLVSVQQGGPLLDQHGADVDVLPAEGLGQLADAVEQRRRATRRLAE
jgi:hypothetical protein